MQCLFASQYVSDQRILSKRIQDIISSPSQCLSSVLVHSHFLIITWAVRPYKLSIDALCVFTEAPLTLLGGHATNYFFHPKLNVLIHHRAYNYGTKDRSYEKLTGEFRGDFPVAIFNTTGFGNYQNDATRLIKKCPI